MKIIKNGDWKERKDIIGDIDVYDIDGWISHLRVRHLIDDGEKRNILSLSYFEDHPWNALHSIAEGGPDHFVQCPVTRFQYFPVVPFAVLAKDAEKYKEQIPSYNHRMAFDREWNFETETSYKKYSNLPKNPEKILSICNWGGNGAIRSPNKIEAALLGTGYTEGTRPCDGGSSVEVGVLHTDSNDLILCFHWVWINK